MRWQAQALPFAAIAASARGVLGRVDCHCHCSGRAPACCLLSCWRLAGGGVANVRRRRPCRVLGPTARAKELEFAVR